MELPRQADRLVPVVRGMGQLFARQVGGERLDIGRAGAFGGQPGDVRLDQDARLEHLAGLGGIGAGDEGAAVGMQFDHLAAGQQQQAAPDPHPADAEGPAQGRFGQLGAGRQALFDNCLENALDDVFLGDFVAGFGSSVGGGSHEHFCDFRSSALCC